MHNLKSDVKLLIQFVADQGFCELDLVEAAERLSRCIEKDLIDYSDPLTGNECDNFDE